MHKVIGPVVVQGKPASRSITFDFSKLSFIDPNGVTILVNLIEWLKKRGVRVSFSEYSSDQKAVDYLDDCGFFRKYNNRPISIFSTCRPSTKPICIINCDEAYGWLDGDIFPWIAGHSGVSLPSLAELKVSLVEIFHNIRDHSTENIGCAHFQWFPNDRRIRMSVSDFGIGIPNEIRNRFAIPIDSDAIEHATQEGVSSKPTGHNRGAGLSYLIDNIVARNRGWVGIYSGEGELSCSYGNAGVVKTKRNLQGNYPGTLICMDLYTMRIPAAVDLMEDLEW